MRIGCNYIQMIRIGCNYMGLDKNLTGNFNPVEEKKISSHTKKL